MGRKGRRETFNPLEVSVQHCIGRVVRRAWLLGDDPYTGKNFDHRKDWVKNRLVHLSANYGIDLLGYAIMSNHMHILLRNRPDIVKTWSDAEVAERIWYLFPKRKKNDRPCEPTAQELKSISSNKRLINEYRIRLSDISWFMRQLAEYIAVRANKEDNCTGRFWEGRFKNQPLLCDVAILACSVYVDLNPVRAGMAESLEKSEFTSVQDRMVAWKARSRPSGSKRNQENRQRDEFLVPVRMRDKQIGAVVSKSKARASDKGYLPIELEDYLKLVDWTGRRMVPGKRGKIPSRCKPILERIGMEPDTWCELVENFGRLFKRFAGSTEDLNKLADKNQDRRYPSSGGAKILDQVG